MSAPITTTAPGTATPFGACDCHTHFFADRYPLAPTATFQPPPASVAAYRKVQQALGLQRVVVVQPTGYGLDNRCTLDAMAEFGSAHARGVAVIAIDTHTDDSLQALHQAGMRGVRFMMIPGGGGVLPWDALQPTAERTAALGWHINLQLDGRDLPQVVDRLKRLPGKLVIDHTAKFLEPVAPEHPAFQALLGLLDTGNCWIKLSAPYETSKNGPPAYEDVSRLARALAQRFPERCLWASNWPHLNRNPLPDDTAMLALLDSWAPDAAVRQKILVDNPAQVYWDGQLAR